MLGMSAEALGKHQESLAALKLATEFENATAEEWTWRLTVASRAGDTEDLAHDLIVVARNYPAALKQLDSKGIAIFAAFGVLKLPDGKAKQFELIDALLSADWKPDSAIGTRDALLKRQILYWLERGRKDQAAELAGKVEEPETVLLLRVDKRFDPAVQPSLSNFDVRAAGERNLARERRELAADANRLQRINLFADDLLRMGRLDEALAVLDDGIRRALPPDGSKSPFSDPELVNWTMDTRSRVLMALGRYDEAVAQLSKAAKLPESGSINVSQTINLADLYDELGRPKEALDTVADVAARDVSPYGRLSTEEARVCAFSQLGDTAGLEKSVTFLRTHKADSPLVLQSALLCANAKDEGAKLLIERLEDPEERFEALAQIQDYAPDPHQPSYGAALTRRLAEIVHRPDVQAVVARVGRIERQPLRAPPH